MKMPSTPIAIHLPRRRSSVRSSSTPRRSFSIILRCLAAFAFACPAVHGATFTVTNLTDPAPATANDGSLRGAILAANADGAAAEIVFNISGGGTITLAKMLPILTNLNGTSIDGANSSQGSIVIDGGSTSATTGDRIFFAGIAPSTPAAGGGSMIATASAVWTFSNLTLRNGNARGGHGGGGGAGLGGAIFVNAGTLSLANVTFTDNRAVGGNGLGLGDTGGGGMGGNGGSAGTGGGGGGFGILASAAVAGEFTGGAKAGNGSGTSPGIGGSNGGGGGNGGTGSSVSGGGGGVNGVNASGRTGGNGGFGGGGGSTTASGTAGNGGFGGGGGGTPSGGNGIGGTGGFGGGGGKGGNGFAGVGGNGGFGGGNGIGGVSALGGGGAGMGGAIFVRSGAALAVGSSVTFSGSTVTAGTGYQDGQAYGANLFLDGASTAGSVAMGSGAALDSSSTLAVRINGTGTPGTNYSQLQVTGSVSLDNAELILTGSYVPVAGNSFTIVDNDSTDAITGTFNGLAEGATVVFNGTNLKISYVGGTGNDVTLFYPTPEIAVEQPVSTDLVDGTASISFGGVIVGSSSAAKTFTIRNTGTADLTLGTITKDGTNSGDFTVNTTGMLTTVTPGNSTTFTVTFTPAAIGARSAAIHIASNDSDENSFDIALTGTGLTIYEGWAVSNSVSTDPGANAGANLKAFAFGYAPGGGAGTLGYTGTFAGNGTIASTGQPTIMFQPLGNGVDFRALFVRRKDYEAAGLTYTPQFSATMSTWQNSGATPTVLADDGTYQIVSVPYPAFIAGKKARFFQIAVSIP